MACPAAEKFDQLSAGLVDGAELERLAAHADFCERCCGLLEAARRRQAALIRVYDVHRQDHAAGEQRLLDALPSARRRIMDGGGLWSGGGRWRSWRAAAAVILLAAALWMMTRQPPAARQPVWSAAMMEQKMSEVQLALGLAQYQLRCVHHAVSENVLGAQLGPTMRRIPLDWRERSAGGGGAG